MNPRMYTSMSEMHSWEGMAHWNSGFAILALILLAILTIIYFIPTIIAIRRNSNRMIEIIMLNIFAGWTLVGWIITLWLSLRPEKCKCCDDEKPTKKPPTPKEKAPAQE